MSRPTFLIIALGCKVSQYDAAVLKRSLLSSGFILASKNPDLVIVNTCSVTKNAITKDRHTIKKMQASFPKAKLVVMGCWPQTDDQIEINDVLLWGVGKLDLLQEKILELFPKIKNQPVVLETGLIVPSDKSRYFLKVGDGCNQFCSYCIIPYARGPIVSRELAELKNEVTAAISAGYQEIVLSGIHLGRYGQDLKNKSSLVSLIKELLTISGLGRLRLSSIEINEVDDKLIGLMKNNEKICQHLHISLQSGSDKILKLMKRPYNTAYFEERVAKLRSAMPNIAISTDIIVGFPGESGEDFADTCRFAENIAFSKVHVFAFSAHEKTPAYNLSDRVAYDKIKQRSRILREISVHLEKKYQAKTLKALSGSKIKVLLEKKGAAKTEFYFDVPFEKKAKVGTLQEIDI